MEAKHTATPWTVEEPNDHDPEGEGRIVHKYAIRGPGVPPVISFQICQLSSINGNEKADAEFIVRACNAHDELVAALQDLVGWFPGRAAWHTDAPMKAAEKARAALAKATK